MLFIEATSFVDCGLPKRQPTGTLTACAKSTSLVGRCFIIPCFIPQGVCAVRVTISQNVLALETTSKGTQNFKEWESKLRARRTENYDYIS